MDLQRRSVLTGLAVASLCPICSPHGAAAEEHTHEKHWTYEGDEGAAHWGELKPEFQACSIGKEQSPIDLAKPVHAKVAKLNIEWGEYPLVVSNNGHTIQVNFPAGGTISEGEGGETYSLKQFHLHHPSEHLVDGKAASMEIHFVHLNEGRTAAFVLGVFIEPGAENAELGKVLLNMPKEKGDKTTELKINPKKLLPKGHDRYRYEGSLTTPACNEFVHWNVFREKITASEAQIKAFAELFPMNARPVQPQNRRFLLEG